MRNAAQVLNKVFREADGSLATIQRNASQSLNAVLTDDEQALNVHVEVNTANFDGNLSSSDDTIQEALETLDDMSSGGVTLDTEQEIEAEKDFSGGIKADTISESNEGEGVTIDSVKLKDGTVETSSLIRKGSSETVADDGTITLPTGVSGFLKVWDGTDFGEFFIATDGTVTFVNMSSNCDDADTDTKLCVYDGGDGAVIKNRKGSSMTVRYVFNYS